MRFNYVVWGKSSYPCQLIYPRSGCLVLTESIFVRLRTQVLKKPIVCLPRWGRSLCAGCGDGVCGLIDPPAPSCTSTLPLVTQAAGRPVHMGWGAGYPESGYQVFQSRVCHFMSGDVISPPEMDQDFVGLEAYAIWGTSLRKRTQNDKYKTGYNSDEFTLNERNHIQHTS